ncbi:nuclear transport factor 2 family protein [Mycolicibacter longobardus]|uniref:Transporter n=1 Tax=Mycolicibacter longobardus TaxID=1108812 RepID=A0A1X1YLR4_9MYCO|nr:nuclear transport factor 2 family protein [Mycolicibacter longobardus]MCV7384644.1 nuclear transport factor 2 family protein [Mycolicibacter longobardus]ORW11970.1 transporter [Mycolicibacter longobardus]
MAGATAAELLAAVEQSPAAAAAHDRAGWVGLFGPDGRVEDPVGSRPHVGTEQIGRFYDTFIGPRDITFHRDLDIVRGNTVIRDLQLEVAMGPSVTMHIPAVIRYDLQNSAGRWELQRLRAYWELPAMMRQFLGNGIAAMPAGMQLTRSLLGNQRLAGTAGFAAGFRRPASRGKKPVQAFLAAIASGSTAAARSLLSPSATVTYGDDTAADLADLGAQLDGSSPAKLLASGSTVAVSTRSERQRAVLFFDLAGRGGPITSIRYFPGD